MQEQDRLKIESCHISEDKSNIWSTGDRPVRLQIDHPVPILLQLLAGFLCNSHGRVPTETRFKNCKLILPNYIPDNPTLCPVATLEAYEARTQEFCRDETRLQLAIIKLGPLTSPSSYNPK